MKLCPDFLNILSVGIQFLLHVSEYWCSRYELEWEAFVESNSSHRINHFWGCSFFSCQSKILWTVIKMSLVVHTSALNSIRICPPRFTREQCTSISDRIHNTRLLVTRPPTRHICSFGCLRMRRSSVYTVSLLLLDVKCLNPVHVCNISVYKYEAQI
jgi:hypothetical protein